MTEQMRFDLFKTERPDFSGCYQFDPEQRTAEAAANRKRISPRLLHSCYIADLNGYRVTQDMLRHPIGTPLTDLIRVGDCFSTNYGACQRTYVAKVITEYCDYGVQTYFVRGRCSSSGAEGYFSELVAVNGRILKLFSGNDDELTVVDSPPAPEDSLL